MKLIAAISVLLLVAWSSYRAGETAMELEYQQRLAEISRLSEESRQSSEAKINEIETQRITQAQDADARVSVLRNKLDRSLKFIANIPHPAGEPTCHVPDDVRGLLWEIAADPRLPEATDTAKSSDTQNTD